MVGGSAAEAAEDKENVNCETAAPKGKAEPSEEELIGTTSGAAAAAQPAAQPAAAPAEPATASGPAAEGTATAPLGAAAPAVANPPSEEI